MAESDILQKHERSPIPLSTVVSAHMDASHMGRHADSVQAL